MNKNISLITFTALFMSVQSFAASITTLSSFYSIEAGAHFLDGGVKTQNSSGDLLYGMGERGTYSFSGTGTKKDQQGNLNSATGYVNYSSTESMLSFNAGRQSHGDAKGFLQSQLQWNFRVDGNATLSYAFLRGYGEGRSDLYDITSNKKVFDSGVFGLGEYHVYENTTTLISGHEYRYSNNYLSLGNSSDGEIFMNFNGATIVLPTPASLGILILSLMGLAMRRRTSRSQKIVSDVVK